jgi:hypothetical protein
MTDADAVAALTAVLAEEDAEFARLGDHIHDRPLQLLAAASMQLDAILMTASGVEVAEELRSVQERIRRASLELRSLLPDLVPLVEIGSLGRVLARRLSALDPPAVVELEDAKGLDLPAGLALARVAADIAAAAAGAAWPTAVRVEATAGRVLLTCGAAAAQGALPLGALLARVRARLVPVNGGADASEGPEGPSLTVWVTLA